MVAEPRLIRGRNYALLTRPIPETMRDDETAVGLYRRAGVDFCDEGCHEDDLWLRRDEAGDRCCVVGVAQQVR